MPANPPRPGSGVRAERGDGPSILTLGPLIVLLGAASAHGFTAAQASHGASVYRLQCARCHGPEGQGKDDAYKGLRAPELVGPGALPLKPRPFQRLRKTDFRTVADIYDFVSAAMPADQPAILDAADYWDVIAFSLQTNGAPPDGTPLDQTSAARMPIPHEKPPARVGEETKP